MQTAEQQKVPTTGRIFSQSGRVRTRRNRFNDAPIGYLFLLPALVVLLGLVAYPLLNGIYTSLTNRPIIGEGEFIGFANFAELFSDRIYWLAVLNSIIVTFGAVGIKVLIGLIGAVVLHQPFPLRYLVQALVFLPWAVPNMVGGVTWKWLFDEMNGIINHILLAAGIVSAPIYWLSDPTLGLTSIIIATVWQGYPFYIMMFLAGMAGIPSARYEAAAIDGASAWQSFRYITLPSLRDVISIVVMLSSIWTFNNSFQMVYVLTGGGPASRTHTLPTLAYEYSISLQDLGLGSAVMVSVIPIFFVVIVFLTRRMLRDIQ